MRAKILVYALAALILATIHLADAQQAANVPQVGFLIGSATSFDEPRLKAFRQGLRELGYIEGKNIRIEHRHAERNDRMPSLVAELLQLKVDALVVGPITPICFAVLRLITNSNFDGRSIGRSLGFVPFTILST
jgi:putative ABC transport system substrate-binding protein